MAIFSQHMWGHCRCSMPIHSHGSCWVDFQMKEDVDNSQISKIRSTLLVGLMELGGAAPISWSAVKRQDWWSSPECFSARAEETRALWAECLWLRGGRNMARDPQGRQWGYMPWRRFVFLFKLGSNCVYLLVWHLYTCVCTFYDQTRVTSISITSNTHHFFSEGAFANPLCNSF